MSATYSPHPIDTRGVQLPADVAARIDELASHVHDTWAAARIAQGWSYGPVKDVAARHDPNLLPFAELPPSEQALDREVAEGVLKAAVALGLEVRG